MKRGLKDQRCSGWWVGGVMSAQWKEDWKLFSGSPHLNWVVFYSMKRGLKESILAYRFINVFIAQWKEDWKYSPNYNIYSLPTIYLNEKRIESNYINITQSHCSFRLNEKRIESVKAVEPLQNPRLFLAQWKEDWKLYVASSGIFRCRLVSMKRGLKDHIPDIFIH